MPVINAANAAKRKYFTKQMQVSNETTSVNMATAKTANTVDAAIDNTVTTLAADGTVGANAVVSTTVTTTNIGTGGTGVTVVEQGSGNSHKTILVLSGVAATIGDNASLAGGALIYTFPAGTLVVESAYINVGLTLTTGTPTTDTPEFGLGTTVGSGINATLGAVDAAAENILGPAVADDVAGTKEKLTAVPNLALASGDDHTVYFNYADAWADVDDTAGTLAGTVVINWKFLA